MQRDTVRKPEDQRPPQNLSIENELKIKRVYQTEPIDPTSWAYMRALRTFGATKQIYSQNAYVEVYRLQPNVFGLLTENADGMGDPWMYLVVGPERAMLIDTGFGIGDLKALCSAIIGDKELIVVNTHGHPDHAGGNAQFGKVYCHEYDAPLLKAQNGHMWDYLFEHGDREKGRCIWAEFDRDDIIPFTPFETVGCPDGFQFDLGGGHTVELIHMGGHTPGSCGFLDHGTKSLFAGDNLLSMRVGIGAAPPDAQHRECASVRILRDTFRKLAARKAEFTHIYSGHFATDLENTAVDSMLAACEAICADPVNGASYQMTGPRGTQLFRYVEGLGTIAYHAERS